MFDVYRLKLNVYNLCQCEYLYTHDLVVIFGIQLSSLSRDSAEQEDQHCAVS